MQLETVTRKNGSTHYVVRFKDRYDVRRRIGAYTDKAESAKLGGKIDELVAARIRGGSSSLEEAIVEGAVEVTP